MEKEKILNRTLLGQVSSRRRILRALTVSPSMTGRHKTSRWSYFHTRETDQRDGIRLICIKATGAGSGTLSATMQLENWCVISRNWPALAAPEHEQFCLHGVVRGHPRCADGKEVTTSLVVSQRGEKVVTKSGSEYELGGVNSAYESLFPNAKQRLLARLGSPKPVYEI